jgi:hypothetical protein
VESKEERPFLRPSSPSGAAVPVLESAFSVALFVEAVFKDVIAELSALAASGAGFLFLRNRPSLFSVIAIFETVSIRNLSEKKRRG